jgi:hypothetical protein
MRVERGLNAHFKQTDGSSRPGTEWSIGLKRGDETHSVMVRTYLADDLSPKFRKDTEYQARTAMQYLNDLLQKGWNPANPGALAITVANPPGAPVNKSRWKLW